MRRLMYLSAVLFNRIFYPKTNLENTIQYGKVITPDIITFRSKCGFRFSFNWDKYQAAIKEKGMESDYMSNNSLKKPCNSLDSEGCGSSVK